MRSPLDHSYRSVGFVQQEDLPRGRHIEAQVRACCRGLTLRRVLLLDDLQELTRCLAGASNEEDAADRVLAPGRELVRADVKHLAARHVTEEQTPGQLRDRGAA